MSKSPHSEPRSRQYGVLPYRLGKKRKLEFLLITTRKNTHPQWLIPKGDPMGDLPGSEVAAREGREEAGVVGKVHSKPIGIVPYDKHQSDQTVDSYDLVVFLMRAKQLLNSWPEKDRTREWVPAAKALTRLHANTNFPQPQAMDELLAHAQTAIFAKAAQRGKKPPNSHKFRIGAAPN